MNLTISKKEKYLQGTIRLNGSKSITNRVLIIRALCKDSFEIHNLSNAKDTQVLHDLLQGKTQVYDVGHAGTSFRFLCAFLSLKDQKSELTGSNRMKKRPIGPLVNALNSIGASISYLENEGFPPLKIEGIKAQKSNTIVIDGSISSQFITALLLIAPTLHQGLNIKIRGSLVSKSYVLMTISIMEYFGITVQWKEGLLKIAKQEYVAKDYFVEADWSAASYYYTMATLADTVDLKLEGLKSKSLQGDQKIAEIAAKYGVETIYRENYACLKKSVPISPKLLEVNFINCPDIVQSFLVMASANGTQGLLSGLQTLSIKETDRIAAMQTELGKIQVFFNQLPTKKFSKKSKEAYYLLEGKANLQKLPVFDTYDDHRMAMSLACFAIQSPVVINDFEVVKKSYPDFFKDLVTIGFEINELEN